MPIFQNDHYRIIDRLLPPSSLKRCYDHPLPAHECELRKWREGGVGNTVIPPALDNQQSSRKSAHDASHQSKEIRTHPTHWPAAVLQGFSRVQSGCARLAPSKTIGWPCFSVNAVRVQP